jgi:uncharacterized repeat protein (TIGR01451 family)
LHLSVTKSRLERYKRWQEGFFSMFGKGVIMIKSANKYKMNLIYILSSVLILAMSTLGAFSSVQAQYDQPAVNEVKVPALVASYKAASQKNLAPGETLTYTIALINSGVKTETVLVKDTVPSQLTYLDGTVSGNGVYDPLSATLTWENVVVESGETVEMTFDVMIDSAYSVVESEIVTNEAIIIYDDVVMKRKTDIILGPEPVAADDVQPMIQDLTIGMTDVISDPEVTIYLTATDNIAVEWMYLKEWELQDFPEPKWVEVKATGWIPYQEEISMTLNPTSTTHFVGAWVADGNMNRSHNGRLGLDYVSLILPKTTIEAGGMDPYLVHYEAGEQVEAVLTSNDGDVDLYVWFDKNHGEPDVISVGEGIGQEKVSFTAPVSGNYLFVVQGITDATYDLEIQPGGGPSAWSSVVDEGIQKDTLHEDPIMTFSGVSPLAVPSMAPSGPYILNLPSLGQRK